MEKETETDRSPPMGRQDHLTGLQNRLQAMELLSQATMPLLPTMVLQSHPMVSQGQDSLHLVLGEFESAIVMTR